MQEAPEEKWKGLKQALDKAEKETGVRTVFPPPKGESRTPRLNPPQAAAPVEPPQVSQQ